MAKTKDWSHIQVMATAAPNKRTIRDSRTGKVLEVRGYGSLKGRLKILRGIDVTKPIYEQVAKKRSTIDRTRES